MQGNVYPWEYTLDRKTAVIEPLAVGVVALLWTAIGLERLGLATPILRSLTGTFLLLFVPGALLTRLLGIETESVGIFVLFSVGSSLATLGVLTPFVSLALPVLGVEAPLSLLPLAGAVTAVIAALIVAVRFAGNGVPLPYPRIRGSLGVTLLLFLLPTVASVAAILMNRFQENAGMFLLILMIEAVALLAATRRIHRDLYPLTAFSVSLSLLLHRNLITEHVVGADIQASYFAAGLVQRSQSWSPDLGGTMMALPMITSVPAAFTTVTGLELTTVFSTVYVLLFSLVPVTLYYLYAELFDADVALLGSLFFGFYHVSFYFTPGKQLISELFLALLLLLFIRYGVDGIARASLAVLLAAGLVHSHYGTTYVFGSSLLALAVGFPIVRRVVGETNHTVPITYPIALLGGATAWYTYASRELVAALATIPLSIADQLTLLVSEASFVPHGTGASTVQQQTTVVEEITLYLYVVLTILIAVGVGWRVLRTAAEIRRGSEVEHVEFTALAVPFFGFLVVSYVVVLNLWIDRVYQMVLVVLAPFMPLGYAVLARPVRGLWNRVGGRGWRPRWLLPTILLGTLLAFNTGMVAAVVGTPAPYTFDSEANDYAFSEAELDGGEWIKEHGGIEAADANRTAGSNETVVIYTDAHSYQMFRSVLPSRHYDAEVVRLKSPWQPQFDRERIGDGYVFIRERSIVNATAGEDIPMTKLSRANASAISRSGSVVYDNGEVRIVTVEGGATDNGTQQRSSPPAAETDRKPSPDAWETSDTTHHDR